MIDRLRRYVKLESNMRNNGNIHYEGYLLIGSQVDAEKTWIDSIGKEAVEEKVGNYIYGLIERRCLENGITDDFIRKIYLMGYMDAINGKPDYPPSAHSLFPEDTDEER